MHAGIRDCVPVMALAALLGGCRATHAVEPEGEPVEAPRAPTVPSVEPPSEAAPTANDGAELEPGSLRAFGLLMPIGSAEQFGSETTKIYDVPAALPRVMRYLQRRLEITTGEIHPLGAMVRNARVRTTGPGETLLVDVGVRSEGDHTMVTLWNRTSLPVPHRSATESLRAAGFDPTTGLPLPENNR